MDQADDMEQAIHPQPQDIKYKKAGSHADHVAKILRDSTKDKILTDVTFICRKRKRISSHRFLLSGNSSYFKELFQKHPGQRTFSLPHVNRFDLRNILVYLYWGKVGLISREAGDSFLRAVDVLKIDKGDLKRADNDNVDDYDDVAGDPAPAEAVEIPGPSSPAPGTSRPAARLSPRSNPQFGTRASGCKFQRRFLKSPTPTPSSSSAAAAAAARIPVPLLGTRRASGGAAGDGSEVPAGNQQEALRTPPLVIRRTPERRWEVAPARQVIQRIVQRPPRPSARVSLRRPASAPVFGNRVQRNKYAPEFREKILNEIRKGRRICDVARQFNILAGTVSTWKYRAKQMGTWNFEGINDDDEARPGPSRQLDLPSSARPPPQAVYSPRRRGMSPPPQAPNLRRSGGGMPSLQGPNLRGRGGGMSPPQALNLLRRGGTLPPQGPVLRARGGMSPPQAFNLLRRGGTSPPQGPTLRGRGGGMSPPQAFNLSRRGGTSPQQGPNLAQRGGIIPLPPFAYFTRRGGGMPPPQAPNLTQRRRMSPRQFGFNLPRGVWGMMPPPPAPNLARRGVRSPTPHPPPPPQATWNYSSRPSTPGFISDGMVPTAAAASIGRPRRIGYTSGATGGVVYVPRRSDT